MRRRLLALVSTLIGIVLAVASVEAIATAWLWLEEGHYTSAAELFERTQNTYVRDATKASSCRYIDTLFPQPYLGFVHHANPPCGLPMVNNVGLFGHDFPTVKPTDRYVVLVTGGSVASQLAGTPIPGGPDGKPVEGPNYLERELNRHYTSPTGKPFLVLNGGDGSWKEPQQFILFAMYASSVDAVLTLDGCNEYYFFRPFTEERLERPLSNFVDVNPFVADENFGDAAIGWVMGRIAGTLAGMPILGHSHAVYMVVRAIESAAKGRSVIGANKSKKTTLGSLFALPDGIRGNGEKVFDLQLALYQKYARGIEAVARDNNVKTAYFIQPIPRWGKTLTAEENQFTADSPDPAIYRRMTDGMLTLRNGGLAVFDLGGMLKDVSGTIYADYIHFRRSVTGESPGYQMMATQIANDVAKIWDLKEKAPQ